MHVAVTGASSGIGAAIARAFSSTDDPVTLVARRKERLDALAAELPGPSFVAVADLCDLEHATDWVGPAEAANGPIDVLVNNAGMQFVDAALAIDDAAAERLFTLNVLAPLRLIRRLTPPMVARGHGAVVNISSMAGITWTPNMADYSASKAALGFYSETLAHELKGTGVHVVSVYPGPVSSDLEAAARERLQRSWIAENSPMGTPEKLAALVKKAARTGKRHIYYPATYGAARYFRVIGQWVTATMTPPLADRTPPS